MSIEHHSVCNPISFDRPLGKMFTSSLASLLTTRELICSTSGVGIHQIFCLFIFTNFLGRGNLRFSQIIIEGLCISKCDGFNIKTVFLLIGARVPKRWVTRYRVMLLMVTFMKLQLNEFLLLKYGSLLWQVVRWSNLVYHSLLCLELVNTTWV